MNTMYLLMSTFNLNLVPSGRFPEAKTQEGHMSLYGTVCWIYIILGISPLVGCFTNLGQEFGMFVHRKEL